MDVVQLHSHDNNKWWDEFVNTFPEASFFHLTGWKRVLEKTFGYQATYWYTKSNNKISGVFPLFLIDNPIFGKSLVSVPFGVYGGIVAENTETQKTLLDVGKNLVERFKAKHLELRHVQKNGLSLPIKDLYVTFRKELSPDVEKNFSAIPRKQRRMIRQGQKHGLQIIVGQEYLKEFYHIYAYSVKNLGTPVFPYRFFENIQKEFDQQCKILSVWHEGKMVAGVMTFFFKNTIMPYYGGALKPYWPLAVNDLMYWELMRYGVERGYDLFDFGRSRIGTGSFHFKRHWGFEPQSLPYQYFLPAEGVLPNVNPSNSNFEPFISMWKRLPLAVTKILGPKLIKFFP